jgi:hypothetical protein
MKLLNRYYKLVPYIYFLTIIFVLFTNYNQSKGLIAYPILLLTIPFLWQIIKPNKALNFILGVSVVCLSSYLILGYLTNINILEDFNWSVKSSLFVCANFLMALWIIKNSTVYKP